MKSQYSEDNSRPAKSYYLPGDPSRTPLTHKEFCDIMRPFWKQRKRLQRAGECNAPASHVCLCDCAHCPFHLCGNTVPNDSLESIGEEVADSYCMEDDIADRIFRKQVECCLPQLDPVDRIIIYCTVLHKGRITERQLSELIKKAVGREYSHQAVHKRIPAAAKRLAALMNYIP